MLKYTVIALLGLFSNSQAVDATPLPMSAWDSGSNALLYYLRREDDTDRYTPFRSTAAKKGHYYYPVSIANKEFNLAISSYGSKTAVVGDECRLECQVPARFSHGTTPYAGEVTLNYFKSFTSATPEMGFYQ